MELSEKKQIVIKAINDLGCRVSAADVTTKTGLPLASVIQTLNLVAAQTNGSLQVSDSGDIAYQFPAGYEYLYITKGMQYFIRQFSKQTLGITYSILCFLIRVILFVPPLIICGLLGLIDIKKYGMKLYELFGLVDFQEYQKKYSNKDVEEFHTELEQYFMKIFYNTSSFLFGEPNPNLNIEKRRWQTIAQLIRHNHGVITAEQLAPYTGNSLNNEDAVLSVLVRFDGCPIVTDSGNIIYLFPSLETTALQQEESKIIQYLNEFPWPFSQNDPDSAVLIALIIVGNFILTWSIYFFELQIDGHVKPLCLTTAFVIFSTCLLAISSLRWLFIKIVNTRIQSGNELRSKYAAKLSHLDSQLTKKLEEAHQASLNIRQIRTDNLVYDTQKDLLEQQFSNFVEPRDGQNL